VNIEYNVVGFSKLHILPLCCWCYCHGCYEFWKRYRWWKHDSNFGL